MRNDLPGGTVTTILHISDLHFGWEGDHPNGKADRKVCLDSLLNEISKLEKPWKPSIVCLILKAIRQFSNFSLSLADIPWSYQ